MTGTKEGTPCSNRGICNKHFGFCECFQFPMPGFRSSNGYGGIGDRGDCGAADDKNFYGGPVTACHGEVPCNGHGYCSGTPSFACVCDSGWAGGDCSLSQYIIVVRNWYANVMHRNLSSRAILVSCSNG